MARLSIENSRDGRGLPFDEVWRSELGSYHLWLPPGFSVRSTLRPGRHTDFRRYIERAEELDIPQTQPIAIYHYPKGINYFVADPFLARVMGWWVAANWQRRALRFISHTGCDLYVDGVRHKRGQIYRLGADEPRPVRVLYNDKMVSVSVLGLDPTRENMNESRLWAFAMSGLGRKAISA